MNSVARGARRRSQAGVAVVDFVLVLLLLLPLVLGLIQLALVLHVRNTLASASAEGARMAATLDGGPAVGLRTAREEIAEALSARYAADVTITAVTVGGAPGYRVVARARVPALGIGGPSIAIEGAGSAVREVP